MEIRFYEHGNVFLKHDYRENNINHDPEAFDVILSMYPEYLAEKSRYQKTDYYMKLWMKKKIFSSDLSVIDRIGRLLGGLKHKIRDMS
jgi:hypothetical protein